MKCILPVALSLLYVVGSEASPMPSPRLYHTHDAVCAMAPSYKKMADEILEYINEYRRKKGLPILTMNAVVNEQAQTHSENMAAHRTSFGHNGFQRRMKNISSQVSGVRATAENVAYGNMNAKQVVQSWLESGNHRHNIEGPYTITGIGVATDRRGGLYFTQIFAGR